MSFKGKIMNKILNSSGSYRYYKTQFEQLNKKVDRLENAANTTNRLFNTLYLDYDLNAGLLLQQNRELSLEFLKFIDKVCEKHEIEWIIEYGTYLGAIRHNGFIPWDDDLDCGMMRSNYNNFIEILPMELERNGIKDTVKINFRQRDNFVKGATSFLQLFYQHESPYWVDLTSLDIFPYDYMKEYNGEDIGKLYEEVRVKFYHDVVEIDEFSTVLERYYENLNLTYEKTPYILPGVEGPAGPNRVIKLNVFETKELYPPKRVLFEGISLPGPRNHDYYLTKLYKNYLSFPKVLTFHNRLGRLRKYPNINEVLDEHINKLKQINKNFE
ncbi:Phosphorylcholine metabolism protein LicD [Methanobrevibacter gottschalkii]|uniref:Phosphorylcholine metabolism protein LicD n=1 Tax=Methanobrevibacter gottschalkii TaxID=190974 RepID=A0A1H7NGE2_9EURY|nr:LicD family protein [Methanobrevibacter gottschalkii]SEL22048.1 Phosphorylcholine metabolism protein LicD [Methanobrevibacter gottschalkii]